MAIGGELAGPVQTRQPPGIPAVGLHPIARALRDERRCHHVAAHPHRGEKALEVVAGGARFVTGPDPLRATDPLDQASDRIGVVEDLVDLGGVTLRGEDRHGNRVLRYIHPQVDELTVGNTGHGWLLPSVCRLHSLHK
jgi:hypothetical protein